MAKIEGERNKFPIGKREIDEQISLNRFALCENYHKFDLCLHIRDCRAAKRNFLGI